MRKYLVCFNLSLLLLFISLLFFIRPSVSTEFDSPAEPESISEPILTQEASPASPFFITMHANHQTYQIKKKKKDAENYYFFLPEWLCYSNNNNGLEIFTQNSIRVNGEYDVSAGDSFFTCENEILVSSSTAVPSSLKILFSSNLPILWIETGTGEMEKVNASKEYTAAIDISLLSPTPSGDIVESEGATIHARGNVSFDIATKKSYLLETNREIDFLGMGSAKKWVLISNYFDQTSLRNYLSLQFAQGLKLTFTPDSQFVDVYINGSYQGLYLMTEKIENAPERVEIPDLEEENILQNGLELLKRYPYHSDRKMGFRAKSPSDITGGYLVEFELDERWADEKSGFITNEGQHVVIQSPKHATISEVNYISNLFQELEDSLVHTESSDNQYQEYIDMDSFVKKYLVEEISKNIDANKTSQFFYKYPDRISKKIYAGPVWDYDKAWGNGTKLDTDLDLRDPLQIYAGRHIYPHSLWAQLYEKESFQDAMRSCYFTQALPLLENILFQSLPAWRETIYASSQMDWNRWDEQRKAEPDSAELKYVDSYDQAYDQLLQFIQQRIDFLTTEWSSND